MAQATGSTTGGQGASSGPRRRLVVVVAAVVVAGLAAAVLGSARGVLPPLPGVSSIPGLGPGSDLERAVAMAPADAVRFSWTDWAAVRSELGVGTIAEPSTRDVEQLLDRAFDADLSATTALGESAPTAQAQLGLSPASVDWELFSQGEEGALVTVGLDEDADVGLLEARLAEAGFSEPGEPDGVWSGGPDVLAALGTLTPELGYVAIDADAGVVRAGDDPTYVAAAASTEPPDPARGVADVLGALTADGEPLAASVYDGDLACGSLAMSAADNADQEQARLLLEEAGPVSPLTGFGLALQPGGDATLVLGFETEEQARSDADTRAVLASGPAPGQGGTYPERFDLVSTTAQDRVVVLDLDPVEGSYVLSDLGSGPLLLATC